MKIRFNSVIYIFSPYLNTGGPKTLHQLCHVLNNNGIDARIVYSQNVEKPLYEEYNIKMCSSIDDISDNVLIVPETMPNVLSQYKNIRKVIWWLSLDYGLAKSAWGNAIHTSRIYNRNKLLIPFEAIYKKCRYSNTFRGFINPIPIKEMRRIYHFYNCEYVHFYLKRKKVPDTNCFYLCGPLEKEYLNVDKESVCKNKKNIIAYNPAKMDKKFFDMIKNDVVKKDNSIEFIAIKGMTREKVFDSLKSAKVYLDFGYFPGPERMPREAVSLYCNLITSKRGSAENDFDVPIPPKYKFHHNRKNVQEVSSLIFSMIYNYESYLQDFELYRKKVRDQILNFESDIKRIFIRG